MYVREAHPTPKLRAFVDYCNAKEGLVTSSASYLPQKRAAESASCQGKRIALEYPGPAALADLTKQLQDEAEQRRLEYQKRILELQKQKVKSGFLQFLREEAVRIEKLIKDKGMENDVQTGLLESLEEKINLLQMQGEVEWHFFYNPLCGEDERIGSMNARVMSWLRSFDTKRFHQPPYAKYMKQIDFQPVRIFDWALTFYHFFLNEWMEDGHSEAGNVSEHVAPQQRLISYLLLQSLDAVTPDLKLMIEERLHNTYSTTCPDVVAIFGSKILPRIRKTLEDEEFAHLSKQNLAKACVLEYMSNRKTYDKAHDETPQTTYMRDVLNAMLDFLLTHKFGIPARRLTKKMPATRGAPMLKREFNEDGTDALYFANPKNENKPSSAGKRVVMLRYPNTKAADLFDLDVVSAATFAMKAREEDVHAGGKVYLPTPAAWLQRIFALFRTLHFRIDRKLTSTGAYPRYGLDEGLREADKDPRMQKVQREFAELHAKMLKGNWAVRDFVGFKEKRLHSNTKLIEILVKHLELDQGQNKVFVQFAQDTATREIDAARAAEAKHNQELKEALASVNVKLTQLVD